MFPHAARPKQQPIEGREAAGRLQNCVDGSMRFMLCRQQCFSSTAPHFYFRFTKVLATSAANCRYYWQKSHFTLMFCLVLETAGPLTAQKTYLTIFCQLDTS